MATTPASSVPTTPTTKEDPHFDCKLYKAALLNIKNVPDAEYSDYENEEEVFDETDGTGSYWPPIDKLPPRFTPMADTDDDDDGDYDYAYTPGDEPDSPPPKSKDRSRNASPLPERNHGTIASTSSVILRKRRPPPQPSVNGVKIVRQAARLPMSLRDLPPEVTTLPRPMSKRKSRQPRHLLEADDEDYDYAYVKDDDVNQVGKEHA